MIQNTIGKIAVLVSLFLAPPLRGNSAVVLAKHELDLTNRGAGVYADKIFAENIILALHRLGKEFVLQPNQTFAFHASALPEFANPEVTMNSRFYADEGYKAVGGLYGNGVCHLASLINWVAQDASLAVTAKTPHDFAPVPGVPKDKDISIKYPDKNQNLYIRNNFAQEVKFEFEVTPQKVVLTVSL